MTRDALTTLVSLLALLAACSKPADAPAAVAAAPTAGAAGAPAQPADGGIAWQHAASDAEVDAAFALARRESKPVFVYWGATWCPPCNQVKATLFNRQDFIERSRAFVPVYIDGDSAGAQKLGTRFKVRGYPTMVLFDSRGTELTRLPGEVDPAQYTQLLTLGMNSAQRPVKAVLALARAGGQGLTANDWRLLAYYAWETDQEQIVRPGQIPAVLKQLAEACPADQTETGTRLTLKALAARDVKPGAKAAVVDAGPRVALLQLLADPARSRTHMDLVTNQAAELVRAVSAPGTAERAQLLTAFDAALRTLQADPTLSRADRMMALVARTNLAFVDIAQPERTRLALPPPLLAELRETSTRFDREIRDAYERQAVITTAAYALAHAGLLDESDALLKANLDRSHSPYYLMLELADNAKKRGDKTEALRWSERAYDKSEGPATRLQWGAAHINALIELSPGDEARIEGAAAQLITEAGTLPDAFHERSARSLERVARKLQDWNHGGAHQAVIGRLQARLGTVCAALPAGDSQHGRCDALMKPAARGKAS